MHPRPRPPAILCARVVRRCHQQQPLPNLCDGHCPRPSRPNLVHPNKLWLSGRAVVPPHRDHVVEVLSHDNVTLAVSNVVIGLGRASGGETLRKHPLLFRVGPCKHRGRPAGLGGRTPARPAPVVIAHHQKVLAACPSKIVPSMGALSGHCVEGWGTAAEATLRIGGQRVHCRRGAHVGRLSVPEIGRRQPGSMLGNRKVVINVSDGVDPTQPKGARIDDSLRWVMHGLHGYAQFYSSPNLQVLSDFARNAALENTESVPPHKTMQRKGTADGLVGEREHRDQSLARALWLWWSWWVLTRAVRGGIHSHCDVVDGESFKPGISARFQRSDLHQAYLIGPFSSDQSHCAGYCKQLYHFRARSTAL